MTRKNNLVLSTEIANEATTEPNLKFLSEFMTLCGDCASDIARATGLTRGGVSHWFQSDDCRLSYCEQYINLKGYELEIELKKMRPQGNGSVSINIEKKADDLDDSSCRRLLFLLSAMAKNGLTKVQIANDLGLKYNTVRHWFVVDDIYVSHIFNIARLYGFQVCFNIKPAENEA